jgi:hypothetical protein
MTSGDFVVLMDADLSHHPKYLPLFIEEQRKTNADIVTGTRFFPFIQIHQKRRRLWLGLQEEVDFQSCQLHRQVLSP